ncbi:alpha/beta hydrolase [Sesbania bispinosa]|nr:alpha/beta hydrolase [Sesbania bispinosa]
MNLDHQSGKVTFKAGSHRTQRVVVASLKLEGHHRHLIVTVSSPLQQLQVPYRRLHGRPSPCEVRHVSGVTTSVVIEVDSG